MTVNDLSPHLIEKLQVMRKTMAVEQIALHVGIPRRIVAEVTRHVEPNPCRCTLPFGHAGICLDRRSKGAIVVKARPF